MEQSKALHKLLETADLIAMLEDLLEPSRLETLSPASWTGMRITLRSLRREIVESHNTLSKDLVGRSQGAQTRLADVSKRSAAAGTSERLIDTNSAQAAAHQAGDKKDLRSALEKFVG